MRKKSFYRNGFCRRLHTVTAAALIVALIMTAGAGCRKQTGSQPGIYQTISEIKQGISAQMCDITDDPKEYPAMSLFYNGDTNQMIKLESIIRKSAKYSEDQRINIEEYGANPNFAAFSVDRELKSFYINLKTREIKMLPIMLESAGVYASRDYRYLTAISVNDDDATAPFVYLIDTVKNSYEDIRKSYHAELSTLPFSPDDQYIYYFVRDGNTVIHRIDTGKDIVVAGMVVKFIDKGKMVVTKSSKGYEVYSLPDGKKLDVNNTPKNELYYAYYKNIEESNEQKRIGEYYEILRDDMVNKRTQVIESAVSACCFSPDNKYLFTYHFGDLFAKCTDTEALSSFGIPLDSKTVEKTKEIAKKGELDFSLHVNSDMTKVLLCYRDPTVVAKEPDPYDTSKVLNSRMASEAAEVSRELSGVNNTADK